MIIIFQSGVIKVYLNPIPYFIDTMHIKQVNMGLQQLLCLTLFFAITAANLSTWALSNTNRHCELFQKPCHVIVNNYNQPKISFSITSLSKCIKPDQYKIQFFPPILHSESIPFSGFDTCQCSSSTSEQTPMFWQRGHISSHQRPICIAPVTLLKNVDSNKLTLWEPTIFFLPSDHLKSISSTIIIV